jgi:hypothetical protein
VNADPASLYGIFVGVGFAGGLVAYVCQCIRRKTMPELSPLMHAGAYGAGIALGLHLLLCAVYPGHLVHVTHADGRHLDGNDLVYGMDMMHRIHIGSAGVATAFVAITPLWTAIKSVGNNTGPV